jgi:hypothetical protein
MQCVHIIMYHITFLTHYKSLVGLGTKTHPVVMSSMPRRAPRQSSASQRAHSTDCVVAMARISPSRCYNLSIPSAEGGGNVSRGVVASATFWLALAKVGHWPPLGWCWEPLWRTGESDQRGGEWEPIKIPHRNLAYIPKSTRDPSFLTLPRLISYGQAINLRKRTRINTGNPEWC